MILHWRSFLSQKVARCGPSQRHIWASRAKTWRPPCGPKSTWRTLSELYTPEYDATVPGGPCARPLCIERDFQAWCKELIRPVRLDDPVATVLPKATGISWPFAPSFKYILPCPGLMRDIHRSFLLTFIVRVDAYPVTRSIGPSSPFHCQLDLAHPFIGQLWIAPNLVLGTSTSS